MTLGAAAVDRRTVGVSVKHAGRGCHTGAANPAGAGQVFAKTAQVQPLRDAHEKQKII